jgi:hypothetical protein
VIDRVRLVTNDERSYAPIHRLSSAVELQVFPHQLEITPAYALVAAGGGPLLSLAALVRDSGESILKADFLISRTAWRFRNVMNHFGSLQLGVGRPTITDTIVLSRLVQPEEIMTQADDGGLALPRGVIALCVATRTTLIAEPPLEFTAHLLDQLSRRELTLSAVLDLVDRDRWDGRPLPRYTVGPIGKVEHYI